ncbi:MAG TPA: hypothetical protein VFN02_08920 [Ktedonobacteraceae bacterium]|nr:hypothetical protein [Ktedonobacteraceae bacterium]
MLEGIVGLSPSIEEVISHARCALQRQGAHPAAHGVPPLGFRPAHTVGDLIVQHLGDLEQEADKKGGIQQVLADHFAKVHKGNRVRLYTAVRATSAYVLQEGSSLHSTGRVG